MDPNEDNSLFTFINNLTSIPLETKDERLPSTDAKLLKSNLPEGGPYSAPGDFSLLKKNFKGLSLCDADIGSTGNSTGSFGSSSESNDSNGDSNHSGAPESILPSLTGLIGAGQSTTADGLTGSAMRESSQSPAFFGFSSSSSSSPPLSQTSGPTLAEAVASTLANGSNSGHATAQLAGNSGHNNTATSDFSFNSLSNASKSSALSFTMNRTENSPHFCTNPLDSMFNTLLTHNGSAKRTDTLGHEASSAFATMLDNATFPPPSATETNTESHHSHQRRFPPSAQAGGSSHSGGLLPTSFSQDSLPHYFQNAPFSPFASTKMQADNDFLSSAPGSGSMSSNQRNKFLLFNGNSSQGGSGNSSNHQTGHSSACTTSSSLSSPIISQTPHSFASTNFLNFTEPSLDQRALNNSLMSGNLSTTNANANLQARFESHLRNIANELNATVQLYVSSIEIRKDQLLKQLDHLRNTYLLMHKQNAGKVSTGPIPFPRVSFSRPDPSHLKVATSFGFLNSPAFAPYCHVTGEGLSVSVEGEPTCFTVATRNCFNEELLAGGETVEVEIQPIEASAHNHHNGASFLPVLPLIQKTVIDNSNGKYTVTYMIPRGSNLRSVKIFINVNGLPVNNSPFLASIKAERIREVWKKMLNFGEEGAEAGQFCRPWGCALVRLPIQRDPSHKPAGGEQSASIPHQSKPFYNWVCSSANKRDYLLTVADRSNNRIQMLKLSVTEEAPGQGIFSSVNFAQQGTQSNVEISVLHIFGSGPGLRNGQFDRPAGIAINKNLGQIVVVDKDNHRIQAFDLSGNFLFKFGEKGARAGQFCYPWDVAICPQNSMILVSDTRNRRIQLFTHFGQYIWHCGQPLDSPRGVAFLSPDRYIVSDFNKHRLLIIDRTDNHGNPLTTRDELINSKYIGFGEGSAWGEYLRPQGLVVNINKANNGAPKYAQIICADSRNNRIALWNSMNQNYDYILDEKSSDVIPSLMGFDRPSGIAMADNILAVVDFGNNRLQIYQRTVSHIA